VTKVFFGDDLISDSLLYFFDIGHITIYFSIPNEGVVECEFKDARFFAWC